VRRLLDAGLLVGIFEGNRYRLAPAAGAFDQGSDNRSSLIDTPPRGARAHGHRKRSRVIASPAETRSSLIGEQTDNQEQEPVTGSPHMGLSSEVKEKLSSLCPLTEALARNWGMYPAVASRMVATYGEARVLQVLEWGQHLKDTNKLKSRGWAYQALTGEWQAPKGTTKAAQNHRNFTAISPQAETPKEAVEASPEDRLKTVQDMLSSPVRGIRRMGERLAADWGVSLEVPQGAAV